ncbi:MAG: hypothetical protein WAV73_02380 [Candidatus Moraniibacteriota bacterium]
MYGIAGGERFEQKIQEIRDELEKKGFTKERISERIEIERRKEEAFRKDVIVFIGILACLCLIPFLSIDWIVVLFIGARILKASRGD